MASTEGTPAEGAPSEATRREELRRLVLELQGLVLPRLMDDSTGQLAARSAGSCSEDSCNPPPRPD